MMAMKVSNLLTKTSRTQRRDRKLPMASALLKRRKIAPIGRKRARPFDEIPANRTIA